MVEVLLEFGGLIVGGGGLTRRHVPLRRGLRSCYIITSRPTYRRCGYRTGERRNQSAMFWMRKLGPGGSLARAVMR